MRIIILKKNNKKTHKNIEKRAFTMYWRKFSSDPYSHHTLLLPLDWLKPILTSLTKQNPA